MTTTLPDGAPQSPACRCGSAMKPEDTEPVGTSTIITYLCSCGRRFGVQVRDGEIVNTERMD